MQSLLDVVVHPVDLGRHGKTPSGAPLYRVVWSDSRVQSDEFQGRVHHNEPFYPLIKGKWLLEKWLPPEKYVGMTQSEWNAMFDGAMFGKARIAYPSDGEYEPVEIFDGTVDEQVVDRALQHHEFNLRNNSRAEREQVLKDRTDAREKAVDERYDQELSKIFGETK